ncbi:MAG TPA: TonB-dependent receptor [Gemmatimonadaceae bacterium]|nr:TonB-dependent receptor [Gemmatimonadaceae bacterium]
MSRPNPRFVPRAWIAVLLVLPTGLAAQSDTAATRRARQLDTVTTVERTLAERPLLQGGAIAIAGAERVRSAPVRILPDVLRESPGIQVQQTNSGHGTVILRGLTGNQVLLMIDGIRLNTATVRDGPNQYLALVDPERIARIEVIRGPGSALYGSDAMGGVVNIVTKNPGRRSEVEASLTYATADRGMRAHLGGSLGGARARARGGLTISAADDLRAGGGIGEQPHTGYSSYAGDLVVEAPLRGCHRLTMTGQGTMLRDVSRFDRLVNFRLDPAMASTLQGRDTEFVFDPQTHLLGVARVDGTSCEGWMPASGIAAGAALQREGRLQRGIGTDAMGVAAPAPDREYQRDDTRTVFATAHAEPRVPHGVHLRVGLDVYDDLVSSHGYVETVAGGVRTPTTRSAGGEMIPAGRFPDGARMTTAGAYANGARLLGSRVRLLGGVRYDRSRVTLRAGDDFGGDVDAEHSAVSGQAGAAAYFDGGFVLSAHYGQGFRAPNIYDLSTVSVVPGGVVLPSADLEPERSSTLELSVRKSGPRVSGGTTVYATRITGFVDRMPGAYQGDTLYDGMRVFRAANIGEAWIRGVELHADASLNRRLTMRAQAFHTYGSQTGPGGEGREPVGRIPPLTGAIAVRRAMGRMGSGSWLEFAVRGAGRQERLSERDRRDSRIQEGGTPEYTIASVRGAVYFGSATRVSMGLENLFDRGYREHGSGIDAPGRHVWLRLDLVR